MSILLDRRFTRTLDTLDARIGANKVEIWTFDDRAHRLRTEQRLAQAGVKARCRSAYKPLLHFFLEEVDRAGLARAVVAYPVHEHAPANRFRLEAYPLAGLLEGVDVEFVAKPAGDLFYDVELTTRAGQTTSHKVFAPNRVHADLQDRINLSPTGWLIIDGTAPGERIETDYEAVYEAVIDAVRGVDWPASEPFFEELDIRIALPVADEPVGHALEVVSLREAMHEDLYFSLLDFFHRQSGRAPGDRNLRPGRIVPDIVESAGQVTAKVRLRQIRRFPTKRQGEPLATISRAPDLTQVAAELAKVGGKPFEARSVAGRRILARHVKGSGVPVMISGGQHANETTGVVGVLRASQALAKRKGANFTVSAVENPDGYGLHQHLCKANPDHMHHAARYTALGDDLEFRSGDQLWEKAIRVEAQRLTGAELHVNLHGYPAHEWTRPLSGYIPHGFAMWTLPKGFFLILRYHAGWEETARELVGDVTRHLAGLPGLLDFNTRQIALYETHAGETGFEMINGFPCMISHDERSTVPVTLITEYPDETIYGDAFIAGHTAQMETVLSAYESWQTRRPEA